MNSHSPQFFMSEALRLAEKALFTTSPNPRVGCVIVQNNEIVGRGYHVKAGESHAEVIALKEAGSKSEGSDVYVTLEPCTMCAGAMLHARVERVVFGATDPKTGAAGSVLNVFSEKQINHQTQVEGGIMGEECGQVLRDFFKERR